MRAIFGRLLVTGAILTLPVTAYAQAELGGTVADTTGGVLPGVTITALHDVSGNTFVGVTDERGAFRLSVRTGAFTITLELPGFATLNRKIELLAGQQVNLNLTMSPSSVQESVTVTGEAPLINTTSSALGGNIDPRQMEELPINGRNPIDLVILAPGNRSNSVTDSPVQQERGNYQINVDGQQVTQNVASGASFGQPRFSRDAIAEFEFISNRFDARQGRSSGVQVNLITKSGSNIFAGSLGGYFRDDNWNASDFIAHRVLPYSNQQASGTFGGPIRRDRIHFFGSYEYEREPSTFVYSTVYPAFNRSTLSVRREDKVLARLDSQFSPRSRLQLRGTFWNNRAPVHPDFVGGAITTPSELSSFDRRMSELFANQQIVRQRAMNEFKAGYASIKWEVLPWPKWASAPSGYGVGAPNIRFRGLTIGQTHTQDPQITLEENFSIRDDFSYSFQKAGRHDLKLGGEYLYDRYTGTSCRQCMGLIDAQNGPIPNNIETLFPDMLDVSTWNLAPLSPIVRSYTIGIGTFYSVRRKPTYAAWVQDDWKPTPRLTLNLGLRWDAQIGAWANDIAFPPFLEAGRPNQLTDFQPRIGFAYSLNDRTVVRGGLGKYFAQVTMNKSTQTSSIAQQAQPSVLNDGRPNFAADPFNGPLPTYEQVVANPAHRRTVVNLPSANISTPYSWQGAIGMQRQLGMSMAVDSNYVYTGDRRAFIQQNINLAYNPATGANYPNTNLAVLPYPQFANVNPSFPAAWSNYRGWETSFTKRFSQGWQFAANYALSWYYDGEPPPLDYNGNPMVSFPLAPDVGRQYSLAATDQRHRFVTNGIWQLGYGFQLSGLYFFGSGQRFPTTAGGDLRVTGGSGGRLRTDGTIVPRNNFVGVPIHRVDMRLQRQFKINRVALDGIFEMFNVFNHANYGSYTTNESSPLYGKPSQNTNIAYQPRMVQLGFRTVF